MCKGAPDGSGIAWLRPTMIYRLSWDAVTSGLVVGAALCLSSLGCSSSNNGTPPPDAGGGSDASVQDAGGNTPESGSTFEASAGDDSSGGGNVDAAEAGPGAHVLISDQFNNRVIEVDPTGAIVWSFGDGTSVAGPTSVVAPNDAQRLPNGQTLISGTGAPPGTEPTCPSDGGGCPDNRVLIVGADGGIVWQYGDDGGLNTPVASVYLPNGNVLITDQGNQRIVEVTPQKTIAWQYMPLTEDGGPAFNSPNSALLTA